MNDKYVQIFTGDFNDFKEITENQESTNSLKLSMVILMIKNPGEFKRWQIFSKMHGWL